MFVLGFRYLNHRKKSRQKESQRQEWNYLSGKMTIVGKSPLDQFQMITRDRPVSIFRPHNPIIHA
jgi:hypothetical protein